VIKHKPCSTALARYAAFCASQGLHEDALTLFREAAAYNPLNPLTMVLFAQCVAETDRRRGQQAFRHALALNPYNSAALTGLGKTLTASGFHSTQAENALRRALLLDAHNEEAAVRLATVTEPPTGFGVERSDKARRAQKKEEADTVQHLSMYLDHLNHQRQTLFPETNALED
jgi:tetratricopeptide (TPR) repeat protein